MLVQNVWAKLKTNFCVVCFIVHYFPDLTNAFHKVEQHPLSTGKELIFPHESNVMAATSDDIIDSGELPLLAINKPTDIAMFVREWMS